MTKEKTDTYLAAVAREKQGYEVKLKALNEDPNADKTEVADLVARIGACNSELGSLASESEPRNKISIRK